MLSQIWGIFSFFFSFSSYLPPPSNPSLEAQIQVSRPKSKSWGPNLSLKAQIPSLNPSDWSPLSSHTTCIGRSYSDTSSTVVTDGFTVSVASAFESEAGASSDSSPPNLFQSDPTYESIKGDISNDNNQHLFAVQTQAAVYMEKHQVGVFAIHSYTQWPLSP